MRNPLSFKGLLAAALLLPGIGASAYDFEYEGLYYNILSESERTVEVTHPGTDGRLEHYTELVDVEIPETVIFENAIYTVKTIGASAFSGSGITSVKMPNTITKIYGFAFSDCHSLKNVEMSNKVDSIGNYAFQSCYILENIDLGESLVYIGSGVFNGCWDMKTIYIPSTVEEIVTYGPVEGAFEMQMTLFSGCSDLTAINVDENNKRYTSVDGVLYTKDLDSLLICPPGYEKDTFVTLEETEVIEECAFRDCLNLTRVELSKNIRELGGIRTAFHTCGNLLEFAVVGDNQNYVSIDGILYTKDKSKLIVCPRGKDNVNISDEVTCIGDYAFNGCYRIISLSIPNSVTEIGDKVIDCNFLTSLELGSGLANIGKGAISCQEPMAIKCYAINPPAVDGGIQPDFFTGLDIYTNATLQVPEGSKELYASTEPWSNFVNIEEMTATGIGGVEAGDVVISADGGTLTVSGLADGCTVEVYTLDGKQVYGGKGGSISGLGSGVYVVKAGGKTVKVVL